ncbi:MAG: cytochrome [Verrucomicrobiaceae bacterium]|nr:cytochrome [Verrucomicrobiaceae bacterium]
MVGRKNMNNDRENHAPSLLIATRGFYRRRLTFCAPLLIAMIVPVAPVLAGEMGNAAPVDLKKGESLAKQMCVACHTDDGSHGVPLIPIIQGQRANYLVKQLTDFKSGARVNAVMESLVGSLRDEDMRNVAGYFSGLAPVEVKPPKNVDLAAAGREIYALGIPGKSVPACVACHEPSSPAMTAESPVLSGQRQDYIKLQLANFRAGSRKNSELMTQMALHLSDEEIQSIGAYVESAKNK